MPPPRRGARRRSAAAAAESPRAVRASRRLSVRCSKPFKREATAAAAAAGGVDDDDGLPLSDEALLLVFSALSATSTDLVRCAATCRRWRRLVSADAAFICSGPLPPRSSSDPLIRTLALGFFLHSAPPRFVPLSAAAAARHLPSIAAAVRGASRVVASRNGMLVMDLRRRASSRTTHAVRLGVCNPGTPAGAAAVDVLPPLSGKDSPTGPFACTVITAGDEDDHGSGRRRACQQRASYLVLLLYNRRGFTAIRCYSSDAGGWGPEAQVVGARVRRNHLAGEAHAAVVRHGVVLWPRLAVALRLDSLLQPEPAEKKSTRNGRTPSPPPLPGYTVAGFNPAARQPHWSTAHRLLGVMPDGELIRVEADNETIRAYWGGRKGGGDHRDGDGDMDGLLGEALQWRWTMKQALMGVHTVRLRCLFEKSGIVIFTARNGSQPDTHVYTVDVQRKWFWRVATVGSEPSLLGEMCGYEMDRPALLASLGR